MNEQSERKTESQFNFSQLSKVLTKYKLQQINPPMITLTLLFKIIIFVLYFSLTPYPICAFILVLVFTSVDFWCTKNLTGRLMVGYKWDFYQNPYTQKEEWIFTQKNSKKANRVNVYIFWGNFFVLVLLWFILWLIDMIISSLIWEILETFCLFITLLNFYSFYRCFQKSGETSRISEIAGLIGLPSQKRLAFEESDD